MIDEDGTADLTGTGAIVGTPEYMAPEQIMRKSTDECVDIYFLGIVFYEMVTGKKPYQEDTPMAVLVKRASGPLPRPRKFILGLPDAVENVLLKALAKDPGNRFQSMNDFALALMRLLEGGNLPRDSNQGKPGKAIEDCGPVFRLLHS